MNKDKLQNIRARFHLTGYTQHDIQFNQVGSRSYVELDGYSASVIQNPKRRPDLRKNLKSTPLRCYEDLRSDVWFRNNQLTEIAINQFKGSRRNADPVINNSWCVTFVDALARKRYIFAYINGKKYFDIHNS